MFRQEGFLAAHDTDCARRGGSSVQSQKCAGLCARRDERNSWRAAENQKLKVDFHVKPKQKDFWESQLVGKIYIYI